MWMSFHIYYYGDTNLALLGLVAPLVRSLLSAGRIERFFFIRYSLGGPHIRLRLRTYPELAVEVNESVRKGALDFFARWPSNEELGPNLALYGPVLQPNNSLESALFDPEVERYGGSARIIDSFDFFSVSSVEVLDALAKSHREPWSRQLPLIFCMLLSQALGFSRSEVEFLETLDYMSAFQSDLGGRIAQRAEDALSGRRESLFKLFRDETARNLAAGALGTVLAEAARRLSDRNKSLNGPARRLIHASQMHMTANRLGLKNGEEVYLGLLLKRTGQELSGADPSFRDLLRRFMAFSGVEESDGIGLGNLMTVCLSSFASSRRVCDFC